MFVNRVLVVVCGMGFAYAPASAGPEPAPAPRPVPKKFTLHFKDAKWADVLDWYAKETGLTLITTVKPTGTFTFVPPQPGQQYTLAEVTDLINEVLISQNFILIRRTMTFFLHPADEKVDGTLLPRIAVADLGQRGRTELVQVVIPVEAAVLDDLPALKKLLSPFGSISALRNNVLIVQDTASNVERLKKTIDLLSGPKPEKK